MELARVNGAADRTAIEDNIVAYNNYMENIDDLDANEAADLRATLTRAQVWAAIVRDGKWLLGPAKWIAYRNMTVTDYTLYRKAQGPERLNGGRAGQLIEELATGGLLLDACQGYTNQPASGHGAITALHALCSSQGVWPNRQARIFVLPGSNVPARDRKTIEHLLGLCETLAPESLELFKRELALA